VTAISFESKFKAPEATVKIATELPEDGGADVEGAGNRSADRLLNVGCVVGILKKLKSRGQTGQHM